MDCVEVQDRLVALEDAELAPGEAVQVREHLDECRSCAALGAALHACRPHSPPRAPPAVIAHMALTVDSARIWAAARTPSADALRETAWSRFSASLRQPALGAARALRSPTRIPAGAVLVYVVVLVLTGAWGASNYWALLSASEPGVVRSTSEIPADHYRAVSYEPSDSALGREPSDSALGREPSDSALGREPSDSALGRDAAEGPTD